MDALEEVGNLGLGGLRVTGAAGRRAPHRVELAHLCLARLAELVAEHELLKSANTSQQISSRCSILSRRRRCFLIAFCLRPGAPFFVLL